MNQITVQFYSINCFWFCLFVGFFFFFEKKSNVKGFTMRKMFKIHNWQK